MRLAVIPARGGSKRIPRKNIKDFCGKPMIAWSIEAAKNSDLFDKIIVSTDDEEIAEISIKYGAQVPFTRPQELSNDFAGTTEVIAHATQWALSQNLNLEAVCCIYATAPLIQVSGLSKGLKTLQDGDWAYTFSVTDFSSPIFRSFKKIENGGLEMFFPTEFDKRSQDLPVAYHDAGQFYWGRPDAWLQDKTIFDKHSAPIFIPRWSVQDIDTAEDWKRAEIIFKLIRDESFEG